ncbi:MAG TPA: UDP-3-O-(3-hydroxymyristoyl)glucosamine N-acyltransferase [Acidobacteriaceae bacterium]|nr:UDP-3-O-(3-hydroxymyristoyl)glucosamine N-acyltransferase [Acidobacteriaceae bacterium]
MRLVQLAELVEGKVRRGAPQIEITGVASIAGAGASDVVFVEDAGVLEAALKSAAGAVIVSEKLAAQAAGEDMALVVVARPKLAFARAAKALRTSEIEEGVHPTAVIAADVVLGRRITVGAHAAVGPGAHVGDESVIGAGAVVGRGVRIGRGCRIYPRVVIYPGTELGDRVVVHAGAVLGSDGFGYVRDEKTGEYVQFPQQGHLVIEDDVEIGANTTIDRGALEETRIGRGVKIDNLVHIGHNVRVERDVVIAAQTGVSGSCVIGAGAVVGGQVGIGDHVEIGEGVILGSGSGVLTHKKLKGAGVVHWGRPARPLAQYLKELAALGRLGAEKKPGRTKSGMKKRAPKKKGK